MAADGESDPLDQSEEMSEKAWQGHRERQLKALGIDPDEVDSDADQEGDEDGA